MSLSFWFPKFLLQCVRQIVLNAFGLWLVRIWLIFRLWELVWRNKVVAMEDAVVENKLNKSRFSPDAVVEIVQHNQNVAMKPHK
jgi:hypothetical protein